VILVGVTDASHDALETVSVVNIVTVTAHAS
jgi:hypothetical protein